MDRIELTADVPVAFVDVETTGCYPGRHRVIDVAVIGATGDKLDFEWQSLVHPGTRVSAGITALTGIDDAMLEGAPRFDEIAGELSERLAGRLFVAHNARFDYGFIRREFATVETNWRAPSLCTVRLSRALFPEMPRHNLDAVMERHGISVEQRHRAMPDAQVLWQLWRKLRAEIAPDELQRAIDLASLRVNLPAALSPDLADDLPEDAGVYRFFGSGEDGRESLLYVGKANNLRERVLDHFRGGASDAKSLKLAAQVRRVEWTETAGELGALLLEAREVRETQPVFNRQLRGGGERLTWLFGEGDAPPALVTIDADVLRTGNAFGTYRAPKDARRALEELARVNKWCFKVLGLEAGAGSCFGLQVGRCRGACVGKEPRAMHLARVKLGLMPQKLQQWPHAGPMLVPEGAGERRQYHVIDGWQHLGTVEPAGDDSEIEEFRRLSRRPRGGTFDIDCYRILTRLLREPKYRPVPLP
ncbi:MAG TPA: exonuclease domain-containing protein [Steroidobacteraceae bacterium]|nr:exonuclease domain-containing protein [Steroidobacteraceae bacterium]